MWHKKQNPVIDVTKKNMLSNVYITKVLPLNLSDHDCVMCVRKINHWKCSLD